MKKIVLASDHGGFELKEQLKNWLSNQGFDVLDVGANNNHASDHPIFAKKAIQHVLDGRVGILVCGTGIGMCQTANRFKGVRAAMAHNKNFARLSRLHNDSNILCLNGRFASLRKIKKIVQVFLGTEFLGGHYESRIRMLDE